MTGVVTATFNEEVNASALAQQQAKTSSLESQMAQLLEKFNQQNATFEQKLAQRDAEILRLSQQPPFRLAATPPRDSRHHLLARMAHHCRVLLLPVRPARLFTPQHRPPVVL